MNENRCICARLRVGLEVTEQRNWNPDCAEHGTESAWYSDPERRAARDSQNVRAVELQRRARELRQQRRR